MSAAAVCSHQGPIASPGWPARRSAFSTPRSKAWVSPSAISSATLRKAQTPAATTGDRRGDADLAPRGARERLYQGSEPGLIGIK